MRQYSQWLHYREVEQLLQARLELLANKLAQLQARSQQLQECMQPVKYVLPSELTAERAPEHDTYSPRVDNPIISALALSSDRRPASAAAPGNTPSSSAAHAGKPGNGAATRPANTTSPAPANGNPGTIPSALFARGKLPQCGLQEDGGQGKAAIANPPSQPPQPLSSLPHAEFALLPEDLLTFLDQHALTDPHIELPHWLRPTANAASTDHPATPVDQESLRTNHLVQRWIERWERQPTPPQQSDGENHA